MIIDDLVRSHPNDGFNCRGAMLRARDRARAACPYHARRANPRVGATRRVARYRAARRAAPTFRNDEVEAQRQRWTFYGIVKIALTALVSLCYKL